MDNGQTARETKAGGILSALTLWAARPAAGSPAAVQTPFPEQPETRGPGPVPLYRQEAGDPDSVGMAGRGPEVALGRCIPAAARREGGSDEVSSLLRPHARPEDAAGLAASPPGPHLPPLPPDQSPPGAAFRLMERGSCLGERDQEEGLTPGPVSPETMCRLTSL